MPKVAKTKLIYVLGAAYSGSTLMGLALGKHSKIINLGEVVNLESDYADMARCTCKSYLKDCDFWGSVKQAIKQKNLQPSFNLSITGQRELFDRRGGLEKIRLLFGKHLVNNYKESYLQRYQQKNENFFSAVSDLFSNAEYIVDLSKTSERLDVLLKSNCIDIWCIYLHWDPYKIYASTIKRPKRTRKLLGPKSFREALWLKKRLQDMKRVFLKLPPERRIEIDFDDFVTHPHYVLNHLFNKLNLQTELDGSPTEYLIQTSAQHIYVGNRWLFNRENDVVIKERNDTAELSLLQKIAFRAVWHKKNVCHE